MQVNGTLKVGESTPIGARVARHISGFSLRRRVAGAALAIIAAVVGGMAVAFLQKGAGSDGATTTSVAVVGAVLSFAAGYWIYRRLAVSQLRKRSAALGQPLEMPISLRVEPEALIYSVGAVEQRAGWSAVTEMFQVSGYWVFAVQAAPFWAPRRLFPDPAAERAFVAEALSRMTDAARERSAPAQAFARAEAA